jgi:hypothetical protein
MVADLQIVRSPAPLAPAPQPAPVAERDLRLDLFRGVALWGIFLDHIPENIVNWLTIRNYGFSDATEIFIFISGYTAAFVYGRAMRERGFVVASARILRRAWQIFEALILKFKPVNMDVLPLYIVLLVLFPPMLFVLLRRPTLALAGSALVYVLTWSFDFNLPAYPNGVWFFNPFAWQLLFVFGAWCALGGAHRLGPVLRSPIIFAIAIAYLVFAFAITLTWYVEPLGHFVPSWLSDWMYPIDKTNLDVLRFAHFLALATITVRFVPRDWPGLRSPILQPAIRCGQHSLEIFCLGVFLAFAAQFVISEYSGGPLIQVAISLIGIMIMVAVANLISWYKVIEGRSPSSRVKTPDADLAGGEA